jgi:hypothetical protein
MSATLQFKIFYVSYTNNNIKTKVYRPTILPSVWYGWKLVFCTKGRTQTEGTSECGTAEYIST